MSDLTKLRLQADKMKAYGGVPHDFGCALHQLLDDIEKERSSSLTEGQIIAWHVHLGPNQNQLWHHDETSTKVRESLAPKMPTTIWTPLVKLADYEALRSRIEAWITEYRHIDGSPMSATETLDCSSWVPLAEHQAALASLAGDPDLTHFNPYYEARNREV